MELPLLLLLFDKYICSWFLMLLFQAVAEKKLGAEDACHLFTAVLLGLQQHGQHEANLANLLTLAVQSYELLVRMLDL